MEILIWFFVWLLLSIPIAMWATAWGRSGGGYFVISVLLTPFIAAIILIVAGKKGEVEEKQKEQEGILKKCPECAEMVKSEAKICRFCRYEFPETASL
jgi:predicted hydrocarbon binding protein